MELQGCLTRAFQSFQSATSLSEVLSTFEAFRAAGVAAGHDPQEPLWRLLASMRHHSARQLHATLARKAESNQDAIACRGLRVIVVGAGPGGLCVALEAALQGAEVLVLEKRLLMSRNNVLKLWGGVTEYLQALGLKSFHRHFGASGSDKVAIRRLQLVLLQVALLFGVKLEVGVEFEQLVQPADECASWRVQISQGASARYLPCDCLIGADGEYSRVAKAANFEHTTMQFSKAVGVTFNFKHTRNCVDEVRLKEFSRQAYCHQAWFKELEQQTGVALENFIYFKDETHYFVMAAKASSLLSAGILRNTEDSQERLLRSANIDDDRFRGFARAIARKVGLPDSVDFALNAHELPDMGIFDFTKKLACDEPARILAGQRPLMVRLVGDALIAPFWPKGTGANRAILGALDAVHGLQKFNEALTSGISEQTDLHIANLSAQSAVYSELKMIDAQSLKQNLCAAQNSRHSCKDTSQYRWTSDPLTRYAKIPEVVALHGASLFVQNFCPCAQTSTRTCAGLNTGFEMQLHLCDLERASDSSGMDMESLESDCHMPGLSIIGMQGNHGVGNQCQLIDNTWKMSQYA